MWRRDAIDEGWELEVFHLGIEVEVDTGSLERRGATLCRVEVVQCPLLHQNREERRSN